jgi:signal peptidase I
MTQTVAPKTKPAASKAGDKPRPKDGNRDFVEQIVVAFILAFLVRGFEAEAFVIPTGSMAPTLMGRHKEVTCRQCGHVYSVNASDEVEPSYLGRPALVESGTCDNCRFRDDSLAEAPSYKGDRILVMKFLYDLAILPGGGGPKRWDVVVFHYPEEPETNYIKRCVGLPDETLRIYFGDIWTGPRDGKGPFRLARRPLHHQRAMQMLVYDDAHRPKAFKDDPAWRRWGSASWRESEGGAYASDGAAAGFEEMRYANLVPDPAQWEAQLTGRPLPKAPRPILITDFYAYNTNETIDRDRNWYQPHWVGDLTLECRLESLGSSGTFRMELVEGGVANRCEIDLATGLATLYHGDTPLGQPVQTSVKGPGSHDLAFANVDDRLTLWVDGRTPFGDGLEYSDGEKHPAPTAADLRPAAVASRGAKVKVSGLVLKRDIYYTQNPGVSDFSSSPWQGFGEVSYDSAGHPHQRVVELFDRLSDPSQFPALGALDHKDYPIAPGNYMMMGDNSPRSKDGRGWGRGDRAWDEDRASWEVPESLLIGKAFFVYWPHGKLFMPSVRVFGDLRLPFRPYVERMKWIR